MKTIEKLKALRAPAVYSAVVLPGLFFLLPRWGRGATLAGAALSLAGCFFFIMAGPFDPTGRTGRRAFMWVTAVVGVAGAIAIAQSLAAENETQCFLRDRQVVNQTVQSCFDRPYEGLSRWMPQANPANLVFPGEDHIRSCLHRGLGWVGDSVYVAVYRPDPVGSSQVKPPISAAKVLEFYFRQLEGAGFTSGERGFSPEAVVNSMEAASKSWANRDRTLLVTGHVVSDKLSGETIITVFVRETLNDRA